MQHPQNDLDQANHDLQNYMEDHLKEEVRAEKFLDQIEEHEQKVEFLSLKVAVHEGHYQGRAGKQRLLKALADMEEKKQISPDQRQAIWKYWQASEAQG